MPALVFRPAAVVDSAAIAALVNQSYRGDSSRLGWTTEADLLDGLRTGDDEIQRLIASDNTVILLGQNGTGLIGAVCVERDADAAHFGMFAVNPVLQGGGVGKRLLAYAESYAQGEWGVTKFRMHAITLRHELIAFYERRGYRRTGVFRDFPVNPSVWQPRVGDMKLELLEKII